jgi:hypothetical protein
MNLWERLASEVGATVPRVTEPPADDEQQTEVASIRCPRCGTYCPKCCAAPAGWRTLVVRPTAAVRDHLAAEVLYELEPPADAEGRTGRLQRDPRGPVAPLTQRTRPVERGKSGRQR